MVSEDGSAIGRVLIVEDEMMVSMLLEDMLEELGYAVVGPVARLDAAVAMAGTAAIDAAVLDLNLNGRSTYPVAAALSARAIPFVFATGYDTTILPEPFRGMPALQKPFQRDELARALAAAIAAAATRPDR